MARDKFMGVRNEEIETTRSVGLRQTMRQRTDSCYARVKYRCETYQSLKDIKDYKGHYRQLFVQGQALWEWRLWCIDVSADLAEHGVDLRICSGELV